MVDESDAMAGGRSDGPATPQEVNLMVGIDAPSQMQGQMEIEQAWIRTGTDEVALFLQGFGAGVIRG